MSKFPRHFSLHVEQRSGGSCVRAAGTRVSQERARSEVDICLPAVIMLKFMTALTAHCSA